MLDYKTDLPIPKLAPGQILVKNAFAGINYIDTYFRSGLYPSPVLPRILGGEASGEVAAVHESVASRADLKVGAKVVYMPVPGRDTGTYAQYSAVTADAAVVPA